MNEIYKGMDNAAEQINENFRTIGIIESGITETGKYTKLPDGSMMCRYTSETPTNNFTWEFPHEFATPPTVLALPVNNVTFSQQGGSKTTNKITIQSSGNTYFNLVAFGEYE